MGVTVEYLLKLQGLPQAEAGLKGTGAAATAATAALKETAAAEASVSAGAGKVASTGGQAAQGLDRMARAAEVAAQSQGKLSAASSNLGFHVRNVGMQLGQVVSQVQAGGDPVRAFAMQATDLAFQFDLATVATKAWTLAASPLGLALAGVAATVAVLGNAIHESSQGYTDAAVGLDTMTAATERLARAQAALRDAQNLSAGTVGELQIATALLRGEISEADAKAGQLGSRLADEFRPRLLAAGQAVAQNAAQIARLQASLSQTGLGADRRGEATAQLREAERAQAGLEAALQGVKDEYAAAREAINNYTDALDEQAGAEDRASAAAAKTVDNTRARAELIERLTKSQRFLAAQSFLAGVQSPAAADFGASSTQAAGMFRDALRASFEDRAVRASALDLFAGQMSAAMSAASRGLRGAGQVAAGITNPLGALGAMGPEAAAIASTLQALAEIGQKGSDRIVKELQTLGENIVQGVVELPKVLTSIMDELPLAIGRAVGEAIREVFSGRGLADRVREKGLGRTLLSAATMGGSEMAIGALEGLTGHSVPRFAVGDMRYVSRTGMALLHEGEHVTRPSGVAATSAQRAGAGAGNTIIVNGWVSPRVVEDMQRAARADYDPSGYGRGLSPALGG